MSKFEEYLTKQYLDTFKDKSVDEALEILKKEGVGRFTMSLSDAVQLCKKYYDQDSFQCYESNDNFCFENEYKIFDEHIRYHVNELLDFFKGTKIYLRITRVGGNLFDANDFSFRIIRGKWIYKNGRRVFITKL